MHTMLFKSVTMSTAMALFSVGAAYADNSDRDDLVMAVARIQSCTDSEVKGRAFLIEEATDEGVKKVRINIKVAGLASGKHAVHIHETAACEPCGAAGGHFDPGNFGETNPDANHPYHSGDLINIKARGRKGRGRLDTITTRVTLSPGPLSLFDDDGSAFIIHVNPDSYCPEGEVAGCAGGARAACGIIEPVDDIDQ
ncbi:MAG: superoxide dismutase family protein [Gammaproteobacteria bacterium]